MSVTFTAEVPDLDAQLYRVSCEDAGELTDKPQPYAQAYEIAQVHGLSCANHLCQGYGAYVDKVDGPPEVNVSQVNARELLIVLGYRPQPGIEVLDEPVDPIFGLPVAVLEDDLYGTETAADFLTRVRVAMELAPYDAGIPAHSDSSGRLHFCGRHEGYTQELLRELQDLAVWCAARHYDVTWN